MSCINRINVYLYEGKKIRIGNEKIIMNVMSGGSFSPQKTLLTRHI
jgi:hypothetical protein